MSSRSSRSNDSQQSPRRRRKRSRKRVPARARRFSEAQHAKALTLIAAKMEREKIAAEIGCSTESLRRWYNEAKRKGLVDVSSKQAGATKSTTAAAAATATAATAATAAAAGSSTSSAPLDPGAGLGEHEVKAILDYKKKHPSMGPAQIRAQLKRFLGWRVSVKAIARVLRRAGFPAVHRKGRSVGQERPGRFEAPHRNALWQLDFTELRTGSERRWLLVIEDDFSRFVVGHVLAEGPTSEVVVEAIREAIRLVCTRIVVRPSSRGAMSPAASSSSTSSSLTIRCARRIGRTGGGKIESVIQRTVTPRTRRRASGQAGQAAELRRAPARVG